MTKSKARGADKLPMRRCAVVECSEWFEAKTFHAKYCCDACRKIAKQSRWRQWAEVKRKPTKGKVSNKELNRRMAQYIAEHPPLASRPSSSPIRDFEAWL